MHDLRDAAGGASPAKRVVLWTLQTLAVPSARLPGARAGSDVLARNDDIIKIQMMIFHRLRRPAKFARSDCPVNHAYPSRATQKHTHYIIRIAPTTAIELYLHQQAS